MVSRLAGRGVGRSGIIPSICVLSLYFSIWNMVMTTPIGCQGTDQYATICQMVTDPGQRRGDPLAIAQTVLVLQRGVSQAEFLQEVTDP